MAGTGTGQNWVHVSASQLISRQSERNADAVQSHQSSTHSSAGNYTQYHNDDRVGYSYDGTPGDIGDHETSSSHGLVWPHQSRPSATLAPPVSPYHPGPVNQHRSGWSQSTNPLPDHQSYPDGRDRTGGSTTRRSNLGSDSPPTHRDQWY